jgi:hypothetical protein
MFCRHRPRDACANDNLYFARDRQRNQLSGQDLCNYRVYFKKIVGCAERSEAHHFATDALRYAQHILRTLHILWFVECA